MVIIQNLNLAVRFLLEIGVLFSVGFWGFKLGNGIILKLLFGIGIPILIAILWATFGSPKATIPLTGILRFVFEIVIFGIGVLALYFSGYKNVSILFGVIIITNRVLMWVWGQ